MTTKMPALFLGHGSPMNAIEDNAFSRGWRDVAARIPKPRAVLCVSAHWETRGIAVTAGEHPPTIHDFGGFPQALFDVQYPAPGDPVLARRVAELMAPETVAMDIQRGLDHGSWGVLITMYPKADVPVVQLSMPYGQPGAVHAALGQRLAPLRDEGVLIVGSGNIVHNLRLWGTRDPRIMDAWVRFNTKVKERAAAGDTAAVADYLALDPDAALAVPTPEHYYPLVYALAVREAGEKVTFFNDAGPDAIFMTSAVIQ
jgi:4,5-DOPA dioxygenase extradiol